MKARVKATGELLEVRHKNTGTEYSYVCDMQGECGTMWKESQLEFLEDDPDYWTLLEHQYAGMAMQGILSNEIHTKHLPLAKDLNDMIIGVSRYIAHALVEKYKKEEK